MRLLSSCKEVEFYAVCCQGRRELDLTFVRLRLGRNSNSSGGGSHSSGIAMSLKLPQQFLVQGCQFPGNPGQMSLSCPIVSSWVCFRLLIQRTPGRRNEPNQEIRENHAQRQRHEQSAAYSQNSGPLRSIWGEKWRRASRLKVQIRIWTMRTLTTPMLRMAAPNKTRFQRLFRRVARWSARST